MIWKEEGANPIYFGLVEQCNTWAMKLIGKEMIESVEFPRSRQFKCQNQSGEIQPGEYLLAMDISPESKLGVAGLIAKAGECLSLKRKNGSERYCFIAAVRNKKWNEAGSKLMISFQNIKKPNGEFIGTMSTFKGKETHWLNVGFFSGDNAGNIDREVDVGDLVAMTADYSINEYHGRVYHNVNGQKYQVIKKEEYNENK